MATHVFFVALGGVALSLLSASCQDPTQLTLDISTNAKCHDELNATAIYVGGSLESVDTKVQKSAPVAQTSTCNSGDVGTLVVTPGNSEGAVVVIAGFYGKSPTDCTEQHYDNCIIARRSFTFIQHTPLTIPIELERDCLNVPCDVQSTCHNGQCYAAAINCTNSGCTKPGEGSSAPVDGGPNAYVDAPSSSDAAHDASDSGMSRVDSGDAEAGTTATGPVCRDNGAGGLVVKQCGPTDCGNGQACCLPNGGGATLACTAAPPSVSNCNAGAVIHCCGNDQCPIGMCCVGGNKMVGVFDGVAMGAGLDAAMLDDAGNVVDAGGFGMDASPMVCTNVARTNNSTPGTCQ